MNTDPYFNFEETRALQATVHSLRQMRTAATSDVLPFSSRFRNLIHTVLFQPPIEPPEPEQVLANAKGLADTTAAFFAQRAIDLRRTDETDSRFKAWKASQRRLAKPYKGYASSTFANTTLHAVHRSVKDRCRNLMCDPEHMLHWEFEASNGLGTDNYEELFDGNTLILAPLTGDYLTLSMYAQFIVGYYGESCKIDPVILSADLNRLVLPEDFETRVDGVESIGLYFDVCETGRTARALHEKITAVAGDRVKVHYPNTESPDFEKSERLQDFWHKVSNYQPV